MRLLDLFPAKDPRMRVLAFLAPAWRAEDGTGSWAWLLAAHGQEKAILYSGHAKLEESRHLVPACVSALGRYLGFSCQGLVLAPSWAIDGLAGEWDFYEKIHEHFNACGPATDPAKSSIIAGPDIFKGWPGYSKLLAIAKDAGENGQKDRSRIISRCPKCGEWNVDGCGCENPFSLFPDFDTYTNCKSALNRYKKIAASAVEARDPEKAVYFSSESALALRIDPDSAGHKADPAALPRGFLDSVSARYPDVWKRVDALRASYMDGKGRAPWNPSIFMPSPDWNLILRGYEGKRNPISFYRLLFAGAWRPTQDIITFDPTLYESLRATPFEGDLPYGTLSRFPAWCVYFEAPGLIVENQPYDGFFAALDEMRGISISACFLLAGDANIMSLPCGSENGTSRKRS